MAPRVEDLPVVVRLAKPPDAGVIDDLLQEASRWVDALGTVMWEAGELAPGRVAAEVAAGQFFVAECDGRIVGAVRFQTEDRLFWPDLGQEDSAFVHRLVVARSHAGRGVSTALLDWAAGQTRSIGRRYLRLDCDSHRLKLRALYERFGFILHSFRQVGPYHVARYEYEVG
jgi:GNAT superfamily N-acetyltransferase